MPKHFILPKGTLVHPTHGDCSWIGWGRCRTGKDYRIPGFNASIYNEVIDRMTVFCAAVNDINTPWFHFTLHHDEKAKSFLIPSIVSQLPRLDVESPLDAEIADSDADLVNRW